MASPRLKREQSFDSEASNGQETMGSASASYSPPGGGFGLSLMPESPQRRDGRKRRKDRPSWVKHTFTPHFDGHLWRKYGQKNIKASLFPRLYYRCSYREDKKCAAAKLVQQENNDDPPLYKVTYMYDHTCNTAPVPTPDVVAESSSAAVAGEPFLLRFDSTGSRDSTGQEQERQAQTPAWRPFMMLRFDSSSHQEQPAFLSEPPTTSSSFPSDGDGNREVPGPAQAPASSTDGGDMFSTWDSFRFDLDDHLPFGDHIHFPDKK